MLSLPKLYPITDARLCGLSHAAQVAAFVAGGATFVQVREKHLGAREFYEQAEAAAEVARRAGATLIVNDRVDIALALRADGVHLGQDDLAPEAARRLLGNEAIVGFSTHSVEQAMAAARLPVSYVAIGPIFDTLTKENPDPVVGLEGLRRVRAALPPHLPLVAIGGLDRETARAALDAGADSVAIISALLANAPDASEITRRTRRFFASL
ncbi:MAG TPA: thiamine phosphate synthase [Pyrinomonadaceae bacterium]|nr:thiamine phosphate synthase [Pyrinomonadaceae bacterium]